MTKFSNKTVLSIRTEIWVCLFFIISIFLLYFQVIHHDFTSFDDKLYVTGNPDVLSGLTKESFIRAFKFTEKGDLTYWHPLSTISHMIDYELFGLQPGGHHLSNLLIHLLNTILLFFLFSIMTRKIPQSAFVAALFAFHPINVDTVAWIAERKNLLSTFFWLLTMLSYLIYCRKPKFHTYIPVILCMLAGLLCKPMLVTLPCVLLLMDFWPLGRLKSFPSFRIRDNIHLILEKIPLFTLSILWTHLSSLSMQRLNVEIPIDHNPIDIRIANAIITYVKYIQKIVWPYDLAIYYPFPRSMPPAWQIILALIILSLLTFLFFSSRKRTPWLFVGWLWYLGTLVPVIGLMQNGLWPEMADRWAYVPTIGLFIIIAWETPELLGRLQNKKWVIPLLSTICLTIIIITTWNQIRYWSSNRKLFSHAIEVTNNNPVSQYNLANELQNEKNYSKAIKHYHEALKMKPDAAKIHNNLGNAYARIKEYENALHHYAKAIQIDPKAEISYFNIGLLLEKQNEYNKAVGYFHKVIQLNPGNAHAHLALGNSLVENGRLIDAEKYYSKAIAIDPSLEDAKTNLSIVKKFQKEFEIEFATIHDDIKRFPNDHRLYYKLGGLYEKIKSRNKAITQYEKSVSLKTDFVPALTRLAILYNLIEKYENSIFYFKKMIEIQPEVNSHYYNLACIYARQNNTAASIQWLSKAIEKGYNNWKLIRTDKDLENTRKTFDFKALEQKQKND